MKLFYREMLTVDSSWLSRNSMKEVVAEKVTSRKDRQTERWTERKNKRKLFTDSLLSMADLSL